MGFKSPDRFLKLGLRSNPFCQRNHDELVQIFGPDDWLQPMLQTDWQVMALFGESGYGKTTAAHMLMALAQRRGLHVVYHRLLPGSVRWPRAPARDLTVIDSIQRMPLRKRRQYRRLVRPGHRLLLVGQEDITGRDAEVLRTRPPAPDANEVERHFRRYLELSQLQGSGRTWQLPVATAEALVEGTRQNRFRILRTLYRGFELIADGDAPAQPLDPAWCSAALDALQEEEADVVLAER